MTEATLNILDLPIAHDDPLVQAVVTAAHGIMDCIPSEVAGPTVWALAEALMRYEADRYTREQGAL